MAHRSPRICHCMVTPPRANDQRQRLGGVCAGGSPAACARKGGGPVVAAGTPAPTRIPASTRSIRPSVDAVPAKSRDTDLMVRGNIAPPNSKNELEPRISGRTTATCSPRKRSANGPSKRSPRYHDSCTEGGARRGHSSHAAAFSGYPLARERRPFASGLRPAWTLVNASHR